MRPLDDVSDATPPPGTATHGPAGAAAKVVANGVAALHKRHFGRGPQTVRTQWNGDMLTVLLSGGETAVERTLAEAGRDDAVLQLMHTFQLVMQPRYEAIVRGATGREVAAFMSANHTDPNLRVEVFVLGGPVGDPAAAREHAARELAGLDRRG